MATLRFALVGVCYISEEHARLTGPPHHRDTLGEGTIFSFLCMYALSLLWPERSRAKTTWPGLSRRLCASISCLGFSAFLIIVVFSWYWMLVDGCYSCAPDLVACCQRFRSVLGSIEELLCMCCRVLA